MSAQLAAERMRYAARLLGTIESFFDEVFVVLEGAATPPSDIKPLIETLIYATELASTTLPMTRHEGLTSCEVVDALEATGLKGRGRDPAFRGRPGGAARFAIGAADWGEYIKGVDLEKLLQEYLDSVPRPPALARPTSTPEPGDHPPADVIAIQRHAADIRSDFRTALRRERTRFNIFLGTVGEPACYTW